jgi:uncharacterized protein YkwD
MRRLAVGLVLLIATIPAAAVAQGRDDRTPTAYSAQVGEVPVLKAEVLAAINAARRSRGLARLRLSTALSASAVSHSLAMAKQGFFGHEGPGGLSFSQRLKARYQPTPSGFWSVAENLLWSSPDLSAQQAVSMWLQSAPHRKNLLSARWREIGIGAVHALAAPGVYGGLDVTILTADFGVR